jgi:putative ATP-dependent endonuclease of OLD family
MEGTLEMFALAADDIGAPTIAKKLRKGLKDLETFNPAQRVAAFSPLRESVLNTAKRFGKARFAQLAARHTDKATQIPKYLKDAVEWLLKP